jgi:CheY-like chemotaxis protein
LTAHAMKEERERAVDSGFSHFLTKPIDRKSLYDLLGLLHSPLSLRL